MALSLQELLSHECWRSFIYFVFPLQWRSASPLSVFFFFQSSSFSYKLKFQAFFTWATVTVSEELISSPADFRHYSVSYSHPFLLTAGLSYNTVTTSCFSLDLNMSPYIEICMEKFVIPKVCDVVGLLLWRIQAKSTACVYVSTCGNISQYSKRFPSLFFLFGSF